MGEHETFPIEVVHGDHGRFGIILEYRRLHDYGMIPDHLENLSIVPALGTVRHPLAFKRLEPLEKFDRGISVDRAFCRGR